MDKDSDSCSENDFCCVKDLGVGNDMSIIDDLYQVIMDRKRELPKGSYTAELFRSGLDRILLKVCEESAEAVIAAKNGNQDELTAEAADLLYHLLVMLAECNVSLDDIYVELARRRK